MDGSKFLTMLPRLLTLRTELFVFHNFPCVFKINLFIYFYFWAVLGLCCCAQAFSSCGERGLLFVAVRRLLTAVASLVAEHGLQAWGFSSCGLWAQQLWFAGLVVPWHMGSSRTRARTRVPCIGRWILNHCGTREVPQLLFRFPQINRKILGTYSHVHRYTSQPFQFSHLLLPIFLRYTVSLGCPQSSKNLGRKLALREAFCAWKRYL